MANKKRKTLSNVNRKLIFDALDTRRKDIFVASQGGYGDHITVFGEALWTALNKDKKTIFTLKRDSMRCYDQEMEVVEYYILTLDINGEKFIYDSYGETGNVEDGMSGFLLNVESALERKLEAQHKEQKFQEEIQKMSLKERAIKAHLDKLLQK